MKFPTLTATREARDSFFLLGVVLLTVAPHLARLPLWAGLATLALLAWRGALALRSRPLPSRWVLMGLLVLALVGTRLSHGHVLGREPGLTLVSLLLAMKLMEMHARRDAFVVFFLGFFLVLAQFFHSQSLWVALWTLAAVWGLLTSLVLAQMPLGQPQLAAAAREAARSTLLGLPIMLMLFMVFPRIAPLWGLPSASGSTGLSDRMRFGDVAELAQDETVVMRLRALPGSTLPPLLYLRGPVLSHFDGQQWRAEPTPGGSGAPEGGRVLRYEAMSEPLRIPVLPVLEWSPGGVGEFWTPQEGVDLRRANDLSWLARRPILERLRFEQIALVGEVRVGPFTEQPSRRQLTQLPAGLNPRLRDWVRALPEARQDDAQRAARLSQRVLLEIRRQPFSYTLAPGVYGEQTPHGVDEFWFDRREGFCEHYASGYVLAMRAAGVPARVVTGFLGADLDAVDGWTLVRNSHAHAWAEYWAPDQGWVRVDPTGAVAPERVAAARTLALPPGLLRGAVDALDPSLWLRLRRVADRVDLHWQQWVVGYQRQQQFKLLEKLGVESPDWAQLGRVAAAMIALLAVASWLTQRWLARERNPWRARLQRVQARLQAAGVPAQAHQAPLRWAALLPPGWTNARRALLELEQWRYGADDGASPWQQARRWRRWWADFRAAMAAGGPGPS